MVTRIGKSEEKRSLIIVSIYNTKGWKKMEDAIEKVREENKENYVIIGGDFNARIKVNGNNEEGWDIKRNSKDKIENSRGKALINMVERMEGYILNGTTKGDKEGEYTYVGTRGCSVIDYVIANEMKFDIIKSFRVMERVNSNHMPLSVQIEEIGDDRRGSTEWSEKKSKDTRVKMIWDQEVMELYWERTNQREQNLNESIGRFTIEERWQGLKEWIHRAMIKKEIKCGCKPIRFKD